jgi:hypothetical protein
MSGAETGLAGGADLLRHLNLDGVGQNDRPTAIADPLPAVPGNLQVVEKINGTVVATLRVNVDVERCRTDSHLPAPAGSPESCLDPGQECRQRLSGRRLFGRSLGRPGLPASPALAAEREWHILGRDRGVLDERKEGIAARGPVPFLDVVGLRPGRVGLGVPGGVPEQGAGHASTSLSSR